MAYIVGTELFAASGDGSDSKTHEESVSEPLTIRLYYGASLKGVGKGAYLRVILFVDGAQVSEVSSSDPGENLDGSISLAMRVGQPYKIRATQENRDATAKSTWIRGKITVANKLPSA